MKFNMINDIDSYKSDFFLGLTIKEVSFALSALVCGGGTYFLTYKFIGDDLASILAMIAAIPLGLCAFGKKNDMSYWEYFKESRKYKNKNRRLTYGSYDSDLTVKGTDSDGVVSDESQGGFLMRFFDKLAENKKGSDKNAHE